MLKIIQVFFLLIFGIHSIGVMAQDKKALKKATQQLTARQKSFSRTLGNSTLDKNGIAVLNRMITFETDSLRKFIMNDKNLPLSQKLLALNCQCYFLDTLQAQVDNKALDINVIRDNRDNFYPLWQTIITQQACENIMRPFQPQTAGLMAGVFRDYPQAERIRDIATLKTLEATPENIFVFLKDNINFSLRDSLIYICANTQPERLINYALDSKNAELMNVIRNHHSALVQMLLSLSVEKNLNNYLPFVSQLVEKKTSLAEIDAARTKPSRYFQMMVDVELDNMAKRAAGIETVYQVPARFYLKKYAMMFFTDVINSLHEEPSEKARYYVLDDLRAQDLYFIITSGETEMYTSSYLYTQKKLMGMFEKTNSDSLFRLVKFSQYRKFLMMAGRYNTLSAFMKQMPKDSSISIINRMLKGLDSRSSDDMEATVNIAETFPGIVTDKELYTETTEELEKNISRCKSLSHIYGTKVYTILEKIMLVLKNELDNNTEAVPAELSVYFNIPHKALREVNGNITQLVLFFGDDDGKSSYASFLSNFADESLWAVKKNEYWVTISSKKLYPVFIYANLPLDNNEGKDIRAQDTLNQFLRIQGIIPHMLIHRGHSYHLPISTKFVTTDTKLAILGSCGGYREIFEVLKRSKDAQIISTKQIGSMQVNEPILKAINEQLLNGKDLDWTSLWITMDKQFRNKQLVYDYFKEYVPPCKNIALLVAALFKNYAVI